MLYIIIKAKIASSCKLQLVSLFESGNLARRPYKNLGGNNHSLLILVLSMSPALAHSLVGKHLLAKSNSSTNQTLTPRCSSKMLQRCRQGFASLRCAAEAGASQLLPAFDPTLSTTTTTTTRSFTSTPPTFYSSFAKKPSSSPSPTRTAATKAAAGNDPALEAKARALDQALKEINTRFGKNSIMKLGATDFGDVYVFFLYRIPTSLNCERECVCSY